MYNGIQVKYPLCSTDFYKTSNFFERFSKKFSNNKFHENPTKGSQVVSCGHTGRNDRLTVTFRSSSNAAKNESPVLNTTAIY